jgi:hypothetical protein
LRARTHKSVSGYSISGSRGYNPVHRHVPDQNWWRETRLGAIARHIMELAPGQSRGHHLGVHRRPVGRFAFRRPIGCVSYRFDDSEFNIKSGSNQPIQGKLDVAIDQRAVRNDRLLRAHAGHPGTHRQVCSICPKSFSSDTSGGGRQPHRHAICLSIHALVGAKIGTATNTMVAVHSKYES